MTLLPMIFTIIVGLEHLYIMYLETFATTSKKTAATFGQPIEKLKDPTVNVLLKNQGIYNGMIALALFYGLFFSANPVEMSITFLILIISVAVYGGVTSSPSIILKQGGPALLALLTILIFN